MKKRYAVARANYDGELRIDFVEAENETAAILEMVPIWFSSLDPADLSMFVAELLAEPDLESVIDYFAACDQSVAAKEITA